MKWNKKKIYLLKKIPRSIPKNWRKVLEPNCCLAAGPSCSQGKTFSFGEFCGEIYLLLLLDKVWINRCSLDGLRGEIWSDCLRLRLHCADLIKCGVDGRTLWDSFSLWGSFSWILLEVCLEFPFDMEIKIQWI